MEYKLTDYDRQLLAEQDEWMKRDMGAVDIEEMIGEESERFDRRKFGKMTCGFCGHKFNPFYTDTIKDDGDWEWVWRGCEFKEPEKKHKCNCPKCNEELNFRIYVGQ